MSESRSNIAFFQVLSVLFSVFGQTCHGNRLSYNYKDIYITWVVFNSDPQRPRGGVGKWQKVINSSKFYKVGHVIYQIEGRDE